jgi:hypothetical protein
MVAIFDVLSSSIVDSIPQLLTRSCLVNLVHEIVNLINFSSYHLANLVRVLKSPDITSNGREY